jgi:hypothetical protein
LDKQIARRQEDTKLIPRRAARLDLRSLARLNYSPALAKKRQPTCSISPLFETRLFERSTSVVHP